MMINGIGAVCYTVMSKLPGRGKGLPGMLGQQFAGWPGFWVPAVVAVSVPG